jgi:formate dehydrogenase major subunit
VPDFVADRPPSYRPPAGAIGVDAISGSDSFIMQADGKAWLFAPAGLVDGPLPTHYEPQESPFRNLLYGQQHNPVRQIIRHRENRYQPSRDQPGSGVFPYVTTTYRLTEHHIAGGMSRFLPYLSELQPAFFCEVTAARRRTRPGAPRLGNDHHGAQRHRGPGAGYRTDPAA